MEIPTEIQSHLERMKDLQEETLALEYCPDDYVNSEPESESEPKTEKQMKKKGDNKTNHQRRRLEGATRFIRFHSLLLLHGRDNEYRQAKTVTGPKYKHK